MKVVWNVIFIGIVIILSGCLKKATKENSETTRSAIGEITYNINKKCPYKYSESMILLNVEGVPDKQQVIYNYLISDNSDWLISDDNLNTFITRTLYNYAYSNSLKIVRDNRISVLNKYLNEKGDVLHEVLFTPNDYMNFKPQFDDIYSFLSDIKNVYDKQLPIDLQNGGSVTKIEVEQPKTIIFNYTIDLDINDGEIAFYKDIYLENVLEESNLILLDSMVIFRYENYDRNNTFLQTVEIKPEDYQEYLLRMKSH